MLWGALTSTVSLLHTLQSGWIRRKFRTIPSSSSNSIHFRPRISLMHLSTTKLMPWQRPRHASPIVNLATSQGQFNPIDSRPGFSAATVSMWLLAYPRFSACRRAIFRLRCWKLDTNNDIAKRVSCFSSRVAPSSEVTITPRSMQAN